VTCQQTRTAAKAGLDSISVDVDNQHIAISLWTLTAPVPWDDLRRALLIGMFIVSCIGGLRGTRRVRRRSPIAMPRLVNASDWLCDLCCSISAVVGIA
jgi:hypothetical protein